MSDFYDRLNTDLTAKIEQKTNKSIEENRIKKDIRKAIEDNGGIKIDGLTDSEYIGAFAKQGNTLDYDDPKYASVYNQTVKEYVTNNPMAMYKNEDGIEEVIVSEQRNKEREIALEKQRQALQPDSLNEISEKKRFTIDKFRYNFDSGARANRYTVDFYCPPLGIAMEGLRCTNASLPGRQLEAQDFSEYGPVRKLPYNITMDGQEVTFEFVCDSAFADRFVIEAWQSAIYQGGGNIQAKLSEEDGTIDNYYKTDRMGSSIKPTFAYYDEYVGEVVIKQITRSNENALVYRIHEAYPLAFAPMELSYDSDNQLMKFQCTFAFRTWDSEYGNPNPVTGINKGRRAIDALLGIANLRKGGNSANNTLQRFNDRLARFGGLFG